MIQIKKKVSDVPEILKKQGKAEIALLKKMSKKDLLSYKYKSSLYGGKSVKDKLKSLQNEKCCFCEAKITVVSHGDVEHYRPKAGWIQKEKDKLSKPGYYWLAYDFDNLFLSCQICNQKYKKNYFPLEKSGKRANKHTDDIKLEKPLIIHPSKENPTKFLSFNKEVAIAKGNSEKGLETIKRTGLNRKEVMKDRFEYFEILETLADIARSNLPNAKKAKEQIKKKAQNDSIYSLMVKANFSDLICT
ncbi:MAG: hypothetical protein BGO69_06455 [Bacteroidetes bacterium 46-16]|nr:MAG: hypothetical protein BGO69_06455 [Bacteroidetes bacterium 46-16]